MKNFFAFVGVLVVVFVGVGIWQGWFKFAINSDNKVTTEFDAQKAADDAKKAGEAAQQKIEEMKKKDETTPTTGTTPPTGGKLVDTPGPLFSK